MKKIFTLLVAASIGTIAFGQTVFQSNLSSWANGDPTDFMNTPRTSIASSNVVEQTALVTYGTSFASLINTSGTHKRFTTDAVTVLGGETYEIKMWVACQTSGELRTNFYDVTNSAYGSYNPYLFVADSSLGNLTMVSQTVTVPATCSSAEFILSLRNTDATQAGFNIGISLDSISITLTTPPTATPVSIFQIQNTTATPADSPYNTQLVSTKGVCTGVQYNGYYLQDGNGPWNGVFVLDYNNTPTRGDSVFITGLVEEYFDYTTIKNISAYNVVTGGTLPTATTLTTMAANDEQYEGVLVHVTNANCTADTTSNNFREWTINDGSGDLVADDKMFIFAPTVGTPYNVTGIIDYAFGNFKILPRDMNDISVATNVSEISKTTVSVYPNPVKNNINFKLDVNAFNVSIVDVTGKVVKTATSLNSLLTVTTENLNNGLYFYSITDLEGNVITTNKFIVAK